MLTIIQNFALRHKYLCFVFALVIAGLGVATGGELPLKLSLADLLPDKRESVLDMRAVEKDFGGTGYLIVLVGPRPKAEELVRKTAETLSSLPDVKYAYYERDRYLLRDKALYLLPDGEIRNLTRNVTTIFRQGKTGMDLGLEDEEQQAENLANAEKYFADFRTRTNASRYFLSNDGRYAMVLAKPAFDSEDLERSEKLVESANAALKTRLGNEPFVLVGRYAEKVHDTHQINSDIYRTGLISLFGIALALIWGLGSLRSTFVTISGVVISMGWALGIAKVTVGQINILTGFLLAILSGLGVEYGIHLIRRYYQERAMGHSHDEAVHTTYHHIGRALFSAALTSAGAFLILSISDFRGFSELGIVAGFGVLSIYCVYMLCFPLISDFLRAKPRFGRSLEAFGYYPFSSRWSWIVVPVIILCAIGVYRAEFEYDFRRMHNLSAETTELNRITNEISGRSLSPAAILAKDPEQAAAVQEWLEEDAHDSVVQEALSLHSLVPQDLGPRMARVLKLKQAVGKASDAEIREKTGLDPKQVRKWLNASPMTRAELPAQIRENFGKSGNIVLVFPKEDLDNAHALRRFANLLKEARDKFPGLQIGSEARIFVEILDHILTDGRIVLLLFFLGSFVVFWLDFRSFRDAFTLELQLIFGIVLLVGLMGLIDERFSILNVAMIPAVLAAGIDIGVHVRHRELEGHRSLASARFVAQAVQLSVITTLMGFGALFFAEAGLLKGIAWISVLGQLSMYLICMVLFPIVKDFIWRGERKRTLAQSMKLESATGE